MGSSLSKPAPGTVITFTNQLAPSLRTIRQFDTDVKEIGEEDEEAEFHLKGGREYLWSGNREPREEGEFYRPGVCEVRFASRFLLSYKLSGDGVYNYLVIRTKDNPSLSL
jgi:hypothetical protein